MKRASLASVLYLLLFVPFGVGFAGDGLGEPYATVLGGLILVSSPIVGYVLGSPWALVLPAMPWTAALVLIVLAPESDFVEVSRSGSMFLWSFVFAFISALVLAGVVVRKARRRAPTGDSAELGGSDIANPS
jgi:hypothetical protein